MKNTFVNLSLLTFLLEKRKVSKRKPQMGLCVKFEFTYFSFRKKKSK